VRKKKKKKKTIRLKRSPAEAVLLVVRVCERERKLTSRV